MSRISLKKYRVSIHALLAECDRPCQDVIHLPGCFNPRTPCGVRPRYFMDSVKIGLFQSTHSLRSATSSGKSGVTRPAVSIHALLAECDVLERSSCHALIPFQSTHSLRSATSTGILPSCPVEVSIHALLAECDFGYFGADRGDNRFNPRTPCGVRPRDRGRGEGYGAVSIHALLAECDCGLLVIVSTIPLFQSTHSLRSATPRIQRG